MNRKMALYGVILLTALTLSGCAVYGGSGFYSYPRGYGYYHHGYRDGHYDRGRYDHDWDDHHR